MAQDSSWLPPGQFDLGSFPRFGLGKFARLPTLPADAFTLTTPADVALIPFAPPGASIPVPANK